MKLHIVLLSMTLNLSAYGYQDGVAADYANESFRELQSTYKAGSPLVDYTVEIQRFTMAEGVWTVRMEMAFNAIDTNAAQAWLHKTMEQFMKYEAMGEKIMTGYWARAVGEYETDSLDAYEEGEFIGWEATGIYAEKEAALEKHRKEALEKNKVEFIELVDLLGLRSDTKAAFDHYAASYADEKVAALAFA